MRLAALLQAVRQRPGRADGARRARHGDTGRRARRSDSTREIGSIEPGKRADLIVIDRDRPHLLPGPDPYSTIVYAARATDVRTTIVDGEVLVDDGTPVRGGPAGDRGRRTRGRAGTGGARRCIMFWQSPSTTANCSG